MLKKITLNLVAIAIALNLTGCSVGHLRLTDGSAIANLGVVGLGVGAAASTATLFIETDNDIIYDNKFKQSHSWLTNEFVSYCVYDATGDKSFNGHIAKNYQEDWLNYEHPRHLEVMKCYLKRAKEASLLERKKLEKEKPETERVSFKIKKEDLKGGSDELAEIYKYERSNDRRKYLEFMNLCVSHFYNGDEILNENLKLCSTKFKEKFNR